MTLATDCNQIGYAAITARAEQRGPWYGFAVMMKTIISIAILVGACAKNTPAPVAPVAPVADPVPMAESSAKPSASAVSPVLTSYERVRALLAADKLEGVADAAREMETSARKAAGHHYGEIATSAGKIAAATDIEAARAAFGDASMHLVALLAENPDLAKGQHVFECPMVKGYRKWVQPSEDLQNPYMGQRMLACGGESTWK